MLDGWKLRKVLLKPGSTTFRFSLPDSRFQYVWPVFGSIKTSRPVRLGRDVLYSVGPELISDSVLQHR